MTKGEDAIELDREDSTALKGLERGKGGREMRKMKNNWEEEEKWQRQGDQLRNPPVGCFSERANNGEGLQLREQGRQASVRTHITWEERGVVSPGALIQWVWVGPESLYF